MGTVLRMALLSASLFAQSQSSWFRPTPPHHVIGNIYYVGTEGLATFLITTPEGHFLINSEYESTVPLIRRSVDVLGFKFTDIKVIVGSHAHGDHMEGDALVKELSGGQVMAMAEDVPMLKTIRTRTRPHPIDRVLTDGDEVALGGTTLIARRTPGHTKGCTTWTFKVEEDGKTYDAVVVCSLGVNPGDVLANNKTYPEVVQDYEKSFALLRAMPCDVFLGAHGVVYQMAQKLKKVGKVAENPFIDRRGLKVYVDIEERAFRAYLAKERAAKEKQAPAPTTQEP